MSLSKHMRAGTTFAAFCKFLGITLPPWAAAFVRQDIRDVSWEPSGGKGSKLLGVFGPDGYRCTVCLINDCDCLGDPETMSTPDHKPGTPTCRHNELATTIGGVYLKPKVATLPEAEKPGAWRSVWPNECFRFLELGKMLRPAPAIKRRRLLRPRNRDPPAP